MIIVLLEIVESTFLLQMFRALLMSISRCLRHEYGGRVAELSVLLTCLSLRCRLRMVRHVESSHDLVPDVFNCNVILE